jgi:lipopolysaccharide heptosyltransferase I
MPNEPMAMLAPRTAEAGPRRDGPRILIVRLSALGDVVHGLPVACALRKAIPDAFLGWVVEGRNADLLHGHLALDEVIQAPRRWWKSPRAILALRRRLHERRFEIAIDLQCLTKSAVAAWLSGACRRIGKAGRHGRELSRWIHNELVEADGRHVIDHYLSLLKPLGIRSPNVEYNLPERAADAYAVAQFLGSNGLDRREFAVLNPGAGWPSKIWPAERYGEVARGLAASHGLASVAVWGTPDERPMAEAIVAASDGDACLAPATTILELAALCRRAALFVGSDTGPMHLAVAVGAPTISLHGPSRAEWCGAYGPRNIRLQVEYEDGSALERRQASDRAMRAVTVDMVVQACHGLLGRSRSVILRACPESLEGSAEGSCVHSKAV